MQLNDQYWSQAITRRDKLGSEFCQVPAIEYYTAESGSLVRVPAQFYMAKYPVTRAEFLRFVNETNYDYPAADMQLMDEISPDPDCPAAPTSWWDAKFYVRWLRHVTQEYYSLPTEIEWEAAAKGSENRVYPWGNDLPTDMHACYSADYTRTTTDQVGTHPLGIGPYGCADMVGNVWEWCLDAFDDEDDIHVLRGGSCQESDEEITCAARGFISPAGQRFSYAGFRVIYLSEAILADYCRANEMVLG